MNRPTISNLLVLIAGAFIVATGMSHHPIETPGIHDLLIPPAQLKYFSLGYNETLADTLWIRVIQDFDTCGKKEVKPSANAKAETVVESKLKQRYGACESSWVYYMIDAITDLAPNFREPYSDGGVILSVTVDDVTGAAKIYEKAIQHFPTDGPIFYKAAYHFLYEMGDKKRAAELLIEAGKNGAPKWVSLLAARLYSKAGQAELGKAVLEDFMSRNPDLAEHPHFKQRMAEIERDLNAQEDSAPAKDVVPSKNSSH